MTLRGRVWAGTAFVALIVCAGLSWAAEGLAALGLEPEQAKSEVLQSLRTGNAPVWSASKALKAAAPASRAGLVTGALTWVKAYTESAEFKTRYSEMREAHKPRPPRSADDQLR